MKKLIAGTAFAAIAAFVLAASSPGSWTGWVTDSHCGAKGANADHASCAIKCVKEKGASWALWDPAQKKLYILENASDAEKMAAHEVTVHGTLEGDKIDVTSMSPAGK
jgi:hypothetical protein